MWCVGEEAEERKKKKKKKDIVPALVYFGFLIVHGT
jgi:hypothetical protein